MRRLIAFISILMLLSSVAMAATGTVRIWGTNVHNANQNTSVSLAPQNITVTAFDSNTTTFSSTVNNATDTLTFSIANQTIGRVMELRVNGTVIDGYQVNSTGWVSFTRTQLTSNQTYKLTPSVNIGGYNFTWVWFQNSGVASKVASGSYFGDNTVNRAVAHGMGVTPKYVAYLSSSNMMAYTMRAPFIIYVSDVTNANYSVTTWDATNFYVGNSTNQAAAANSIDIWNWVAWG